jgi:hypothetical protein
LGNRNNEGGLVWGDEEVNRWWEHSTIKEASGRQWDGMKTKEGLGQGRGESRRIQTNRTTTTMWAKDSNGNENNNA